MGRFDKPKAALGKALLVLKGMVAGVAATVTVITVVPEGKVAARSYFVKPPEKVTVETVRDNGTTGSIFDCTVFPFGGSQGQMVITDVEAKRSQTYNCAARD